jgi:hypothetical protein
MDYGVRYRDLWRLLRRLGYNCGRIINDGKHRVCEHPSSGSFLALADRSPSQPVHREVLFGVRLELDNFGILSREEYDRWIKRRAKANSANGPNGAVKTKRTTRSRAPRGST